MGFFYLWYIMKINELYNCFKECSSVITDSRKTEKGAMFFALKGENFNGNKYATQAIQSGCSYAVVDDKNLDGNAGLIVVDNVLETLQLLANYHRNQLNIPIVAITGTNGKTTTKELIASVLQKKYKVLYTHGNFNNHIGVPLTLLELDEDHEIGIVEMGANHIGEIADLCKIADPDYGIITNIGKAHIEGFGSFENVKKTKKELYDYIKAKNGKIFYNTENEILSEIVKDMKLENVGFNCSTDLKAKALETDKYLNIGGKYNHNTFEIKTNLIGNYNLENVLAALCIGNFFNVNFTVAIKAIEEYVPSNNRSQFVKTDYNNLILDAYNANPTSVNAALLNFISLKLNNKVVILGDMLELGDEAIKEHKAIIKLLKGEKIERVILVGDIYKSLAKDEDNIQCFKLVDELIDWLSMNKIKTSNILIKGSRGIKLEKIVEYL